MEVAKNPNTPVTTLEKLALDEEQIVRWYLASKPNTSPEVLKKLAKDGLN
jgi:hypothetical protein